MGIITHIMGVSWGSELNWTSEDKLEQVQTLGVAQVKLLKMDNFGFEDFEIEIGYGHASSTGTHGVDCLAEVNSDSGS